METEQIKKLRDSIICINNIHKEFSDFFYSKYQSSFPHFNLRKMDVSSAFDKQHIFSLDFLDYVDLYITILNTFMATNEDLDRLSASSLGTFRTRVKMRDSVLNKLMYYTKVKEEAVGGLKMFKCLNDLFGLRFIIDSFDYEDDKMLKCVEDLKKRLPLMRAYYRDKEGYHGYHIYFKNKNNLYFPWELQLWSTRDMYTNNLAHEKHKSKREYISWPKKYKESQNLDLRRKG